MNQLTKVFNFNNNQVRVLTIKGKPWFVGNDISKVLGYQYPKDAVRKHIDNDDKFSLSYKARAKMALASLTRKNNFNPVILINEAGVYALIFGSKLPSARQFKHWVTHEVLPTIRKTGSYGKPNYRLPQTYLEAMELATASLRKNKQMQSKVDEYHQFIKNPGTMTTTSIAKDYGMSARQLNAKLHDLGIIYKQGKTWVLYKKYQDMGLTHNDEYRDGLNRVVSILMKWTTMGKKFIHDVLGKQGIYLLTEKQGFGNLLNF